MLSSIYPELHEDDAISKYITIQVTDACNLACTYCYQKNKGTRSIKVDYAKKLIDGLLEDAFHPYISLGNTPGIVLEFIGGEPLLEIEVIDEICSYFMDKAIDSKHPWAERSCFSLCSNGVLVNTEPVQKFLDKWSHHLSLTVTIDGNKELHDLCRRFPDGRPSYDIAIDAVKNWKSRGRTMGSKITIVPENLKFVSKAIIDIVKNLDCVDVHANTCYEQGWTIEHAKVFYNELKKIAEYWNDQDIVQTHYLSLFEEDSFKPKSVDDDNNWCGGTGKMLAMDPDGYLYPCLRYMSSSLGDDQEEMIIGHVNTGIAKCKKCSECVNMLNAITRRSQSTDECFYCPIGDGCAWCSAYNYQVFGTPNKRTTFICDMHKARALANVYFWNTYYRKHNIIDEETHKQRRFVNYCPDEWALEIISQEELDMLKELASD